MQECMRNVWPAVSTFLAVHLLVRSQINKEQIAVVYFLFPFESMCWSARSYQAAEHSKQHLWPAHWTKGQEVLFLSFVKYSFFFLAREEGGSWESRDSGFLSGPRVGPGALGTKLGVDGGSKCQHPAVQQTWRPFYSVATLLACGHRYPFPQADRRRRPL